MKRWGFTLAEVLITLGILGVVGAMTIPTLMNEADKANRKMEHPHSEVTHYDTTSCHCGED